MARHFSPICDVTFNINTANSTGVAATRRSTVHVSIGATFISSVWITWSLHPRDSANNYEQPRSYLGLRKHIGLLCNHTRSYAFSNNYSPTLCVQRGYSHVHKMQHGNLPVKTLDNHFTLTSISLASLPLETTSSIAFLLASSFL
jgi:hypothetical protein